MQVEVDSKSGFCFGVIRAIEKVEQALDNSMTLYSLGEIVHNGVEVRRLKSRGLIVVNHKEFAKLKDVTVLIRAHGEPPETYEIARQNNITLIDATCPVVLKLQENIRKCYAEAKKNNAQLVILGQKGHAEVNGLVGQVDGDAIVVDGVDDGIDFSRSVELFSQTTKDLEQFNTLCNEIEKRVGKEHYFKAHDTICRQVSHRKPHLQRFARTHDVVIFVSGRTSSNGKVLYDVCKEVNKQTYLVEDATELQSQWFEGVQTVGVCGATSTPQWLMEKVADAIRSIAL